MSFVAVCRFDIVHTNVNVVQASDMVDPSHAILSKMTPVSVEETYANGLISVLEKRSRKERTMIVTLMFWNPWGKMVYTPGDVTLLANY